MIAMLTGNFCTYTPKPMAGYSLSWSSVTGQTRDKALEMLPSGWQHSNNTSNNDDYRTDDSPCGAPDPVGKCGFSAVRKFKNNRTMPRVRKMCPKPDIPAVAVPGSLPT